MRRTLAMTLLALSVSACASFYQPSATAWVKCEDKAHCDTLWDRAQTWIATNGAYRLQTITQSVIQTYGPHDNVYGRVAYTITKEGRPDGNTYIVIRGSCAPTLYGCVFDPSEDTNRLHSALTR